MWLAMIISRRARPTPAFGSMAKSKALGIGHVHHDLSTRRHLAEIGRDRARTGSFARVDGAGVAPRRRTHGDLRAVGNPVQRIATTHHGRHAQFARDDCGVAGVPRLVTMAARLSSAPVRDRSCRRPARRRAVTPIPCRPGEARRAGADLIGPMARLGQHGSSMAPRLEALDLRGLATRLSRLGRLHNVELAGHAVPSPTRCGAAIALDHQRRASSPRPHRRCRTSCGRRPAISTFTRSPGALEYTMRCCLAPSWRRRMVGLPAVSGLVNVELVGIHGALHHHLAQAVAAREEDGVAGSPIRCRRREQHA